MPLWTFSHVALLKRHTPLTAYEPQTETLPGFGMDRGAPRSTPPPTEGDRGPVVPKLGQRLLRLAAAGAGPAAPRGHLGPTPSLRRRAGAGTHDKWPKITAVPLVGLLFAGAPSLVGLTLLFWPSVEPRRPLSVTHTSRPALPAGPREGRRAVRARRGPCASRTDARRPGVPDAGPVGLGGTLWAACGRFGGRLG